MNWHHHVTGPDKERSMNPTDWNHFVISVDSTQLDAALAKARELERLCGRPDLTFSTWAALAPAAAVVAAREAGTPITRRQLFSFLRRRA